jgi:hypothetical protein
MWWDKRPEWLDELGANMESMREDSKRYNEESRKRDDELRARINALTLNVNGIRDSNGLFPEYNGLKIYLGLAALAFEDDAVEEARKHGVGLLQQVGDTVEYATDWEVKAY